MKRVRMGFALVGALLLALLALVVQRAEQSLAYERVARHDAVAERLFDEIEGELSAFLEEEEERGPEAYGGRWARRGQFFVVGVFRLHPDGSLETNFASAAPAALLEQLKRLTRDATASSALGAGTLSGFESKAAPQKDRKSSASLNQRAGSTQNLKTGKGDGRALGADDKREDYSAYDALQSLNRSVQRRVSRKERSLGTSTELEAEERSNAPNLDENLEVDSDDGFAKQILSPPRVRAPVQARVLDANHLLLFRTTVRGGRATRQGLWLDTTKFLAWLEEGVLGASSVGGYATLRFSGPFDRAEEPTSGEFVYRHRFAEPFDELQATLALEALPGLGGAVYTRALSALLFLAAILGLLALYRMVAVAFRFAERRSNFAAAVSHELKTPLTAIRMYAEMLRDDLVADESKRREYYASITNESERLSRLIDNVLEFSKLEKGRHELALVVGSIEPVVREVERLLAAHVKSAGFELAIEIEPGLPPVRFDRDAVIQVLFNLVDNALKYAKEAETRQITLRCQRAEGGVTVAVRDFGPGVAQGELRKVFEPFYRSEPELTRRSTGSGIGLSLVRALGEAMGATVRAENAEPTGLRVSLRLAAG